VTVSVPARRAPAWRREFEAGKIEARRHHAADQRPAAARLGRLPPAGGHQRLRTLARQDVVADADRLDRAGVVPRDQQVGGRTGVEQPQLGGVDPVPVRALSRFEQEIDRGGMAAAAALAPGLAVPATLGMWREP
jgi:hypothetical protein